MANQTIDILMITWNRPEYTRLALERLLDTCDGDMRVWVWHNGNDGPTLEVVQSASNHPRVHRLHHSLENKKLREPTNWLLRESTADFVCKVDDDCLMPFGWAQTLRQAHAEVAQFGVLGCWRFPDEDFVPEVANRKIRQYGRHRILQNCWVEGSGFLMKRACIQEGGLIGENDSFPGYCIRLAARGWVNGWYYPFLYQEHMDDPRAPHSLLKTDEDLKRYLPLSAAKNGVRTLGEWQAQLRRSARLVQEADPDPRQYVGWRAAVRRCHGRVRRLLGKKAAW